jgi:hypothetical protein
MVRGCAAGTQGHLEEWERRFTLAFGFAGNCGGRHFACELREKKGRKVWNVSSMKARAEKQERGKKNGLSKI